MYAACMAIDPELEYLDGSFAPIVLKKAAAVPQTCNKFDVITSKSLKTHALFIA